MLPQTLSIPCPPPAPLQEDNHSYYVSRTYGPGDARLRGLWVDMAAANRSHVKIHGILSNTHRQASVSPTGPRLSPGSPLPAGIFPRGWGAARPTGGCSSSSASPGGEQSVGSVWASPEPWGGRRGQGTSRGCWVPAPIPLPSLRAPAPGACSEAGAIPVPAPRGFPPPYCCSHPPFSSPEDRPLLRLPLLRPPPAAGDDRHGR